MQSRIRAIPLLIPLHPLHQSTVPQRAHGQNPARDVKPCESDSCTGPTAKTRPGMTAALFYSLQGPEKSNFILYTFSTQCPPSPQGFQQRPLWPGLQGRAGSPRSKAHALAGAPVGGETQPCPPVPRLGPQRPRRG